MVAESRKRSFSSLPLLGKGGFGTVKFTRVEGKQMAVKVVRKPASLPTAPSTTSSSPSASDNCDNSTYILYREKQQSKVECSRQEAALLAILSHDNIVKLYKFEEDDHELRLYEEYAPGKPSSCSLFSLFLFVLSQQKQTF
jgi:serine/threonine protein kinase